MVINTKINKQAYKKMKDNPFKNFANGVVTKGKGNPDYDGQASLILDVEGSAVAFAASLSLAEEFGGTDRTGAKDLDRAKLEQSLDSLVKELEVKAVSLPDAAAFLEYLGFELAKVPGRRTGIVKPPVVQTLKSGGSDPRRGVVKCVLKAEDASEVKAVVVKRSDDNGQTWVNGMMSTKLAFELGEQPSGVYALYQFKFLATNNRESDWCAFKGVPIT